MKTVKKEMSSFVSHDNHVNYHKKQMEILLENLSYGEIVIKCDFIQNIVHSRGRETSSSYYGKRQTQLLSCVIWYIQRHPNGTDKKRKIFVDYLSSYLKHNSLYFQKCLVHLLTYLRDNLKVYFDKVNILF